MGLEKFTVTKIGGVVVLVNDSLLDLLRQLMENGKTNRGHGVGVAGARPTLLISIEMVKFDHSSKEISTTRMVAPVG